VQNTDQTNFPVLINTIDPTLASTANGGHVANANGYDIVFTSDATCSKNLNFEIESWNATSGQLVAWVQLPVLSHVSDTNFFVCYGNPAIATAQSNPSGVWDSNYKGVWHLGNGSALSLVAMPTTRSTTGRCPRPARSPAEC
jgi:biopolymer transport protein ExbB